MGMRCTRMFANPSTSRAASVSPGKMSSHSSSKTSTEPFMRWGLTASSAALVGL
jgi:hypothetical protein